MSTRILLYNILMQQDVSTQLGLRMDMSNIPKLLPISVTDGFETEQREGVENILLEYMYPPFM
jgi:hypothetical protein